MLSYTVLYNLKEKHFEGNELWIMVLIIDVYIF